MYSLENIKSRSASQNEVIVNYIDTMELLYLFEKSNTKVLGWEGWIKRHSGLLESSKQYQGIEDLSHMENASSIALVKSTIMQAHIEWEEKPSVNNAELLFSIRTNT